MDPARDLAKYIGEQTAWHDPEERFFFRPEYVDELRALEADIEQLAAYAATGIDLISSSAPITRSPWLDLSMRFTPLLA